MAVMTEVQIDGIGEAVYALATELVRQMPRDMSLTSVATLSTLVRNGPRRVTELAASEGVAQPSMTALVTALERDGLVSRHADPRDKRAALVTVTDAGRDLVARRRRLGAELVTSTLDELSDDERSALADAVGALRRVREIRAAHREDAVTARR
ncbi:DNA-binding transcriptional regulator, MarR family [Williamsia serinedens]|uniref:DNA-binding transcriptional regulator, MarR family n=2 Tax=Williamsia serinedens TaxID=391736 RepID=A0ABT1H1I4_9NOCA|nr:DNA-binding transcriptional regulator, MarR family [Williamsia serinedens]